MEEKRQARLEAFLKMDLKKQEQYDFREEIVTFHTADAIERHIIYQAIGIAQQGGNGIAAQESKNIYRKQSMRDHSRRAEADNSLLLQDLFCRLWQVEIERFGCLQECITLSCDTMNSPTTTLNELISLHKETLGISGKVSKRKTVKAYVDHEETFRSIIPQEAQKFLKVAYTIGNFIPIPAGCNVYGTMQDYWDLKLLCIYRWYMDGSDAHIESIVGKKNISTYKAWLQAFNNWNNFVKCNFLEDFVETGNKGYGKPKELWTENKEKKQEGHFSGKVLPQEKDQFEQFFTNASSWILNRGQKMVEKLKETPKLDG